MKRCLALFSALLLAWMSFGPPVLANESFKVVVFGEYSNVVTSMPNDPHQSGYAVVIYKRSDGLLFGRFTYAPGTTEGFGGNLFDIRIDGRRVSFKAKVSTYYDDKRRGRSKELFEFSGVVKGNALAGDLTLWDGYDLSKPVEAKHVKLVKKSVWPVWSFEEFQSVFPEVAW